MNILYYALDDALKKDILLDPGQLQSRQGKYRSEFLLAIYFWMLARLPCLTAALLLPGQQLPMRFLGHKPGGHVQRFQAGLLFPVLNHRC